MNNRKCGKVVRHTKFSRGKERLFSAANFSRQCPLVLLIKLTEDEDKLEIRKAKA
jgi:hypothetical protein